MRLGELEHEIGELSEAIVDLPGANRPLQKLREPEKLKISPAHGIHQPGFRCGARHEDLLSLADMGQEKEWCLNLVDSKLL
jgi:hypothetical protein